MKEHEFVLILVGDIDESGIDKLYGVIDDGTFSTTSRVSQVHFHREAGSLEDAIKSAIRDVRKAGIEVGRVEIEPDVLAGV